MKTLQTFAKKAGDRFTGTLGPGVRLQKPEPMRVQPMEGIVGPEEELARELSRELEAPGVEDEEQEIDDDLGERAEGEKLSEDLLAIYVVADD